MQASTSATATGNTNHAMGRAVSYAAWPASQGAPLSSTDFALIVFVGAIILFLAFTLIAVWVTAKRARIGIFSASRPEARRRQAIEGPSMIVDTRENVEPLVNALKSADWEARNEVVSALGNIGGEHVVDPLINVLLHDENAKVRENAACWLGLIGNERAVLPLMRVVKNYLAGSDTATNVAVASAAALGDIGNPEGLTVVKKLSAALGQSAGPENLKRVSHAVKDIELTKDLTAEKCIVCNLPLGNEEELVQCPFCKNIAHKDHMFDWLRVRDYCPACRATISEFSLMTVQPKKSPSVRPKRLSTKSKPRSEKKK